MCHIVFATSYKQTSRLLILMSSILELRVLMYLRRSKYRSLFTRHNYFLLFSEHSTVSKNQMEFKDLFLQRNSGRRRNENIILPRPETNFIRNSIRFRGAIAWNTLTNKETRAKTLKEFKRCLVKFDTDKMHFEPILATTKNRDIGYEYF